MNTLEQEIKSALSEAKILEMARDEFSEENMLFTAQRLSGASYSFIRMVYDRQNLK